MASCTHDDAGTYLSVYNPRFPCTLQAREAVSTVKSRARSLQQVVVKLTAANPVANRLAVVDFDLASAHAAGAEAGDWLKGAPQTIVLRFYIEFAKNGRRDPSAANFVARETALVEDDRVQTALCQFPCARRSSRPSAHDQDIARIHSGSFSSIGLSE